MREKKPQTKRVPQIADKRDFFNDVYEIVRLIPVGRVSTYGAIANYLSLKSGARMVGWALSSSQSTHSDVPAQRVINRNGQLSGRLHFATPTLMQELLEKEGIIIKDNTVQNFSELFWDPVKELL